MNTEHITEHLQELDRQIAQSRDPAENFALCQQRKRIMDQLVRAEELKSPVMVVQEGTIHPHRGLRDPFKLYDQVILDDLVSPEQQKTIEKKLDKVWDDNKAFIENVRAMDVAKAKAKAIERLSRSKKTPASSVYEPPVRAPRRYKLVRVSMSSMSMLMTCFTMGNSFHFEMDLPEGARMIRWFPDPVRDCLCMIFEHPDFADVEDGADIPEAAPGSFCVVK